MSNGQRGWQVGHTVSQIVSHENGEHIQRTKFDDQTFEARIKYDGPICPHCGVLMNGY